MASVNQHHKWLTGDLAKSIAEVSPLSSMVDEAVEEFSNQAARLLSRMVRLLSAAGYAEGSFMVGEKVWFDAQTRKMHYACIPIFTGEDHMAQEAEWQRKIAEAVARREEERTRFEEDAGPYGFDLTRDVGTLSMAGEPWGEYCDADTGHRWGGWLAAKGL